MDYLKTALIEEKQNGYLLRLSAHLALFYRSASFQIKVSLTENDKKKNIYVF